MPVVGVEPTRVISTRDFEFLSASSIWCHPVISSDIWFPLRKGKIHASTNNNLKYPRFFDAFFLYSVFSVWTAQMEIGGMFRRDAWQNAPLLRHKTKGKSRIMNQNQAKEYYEKLFVNYPDVLSVEEATTLSEQCWIPCPLWKVLASGQLARNGRQPDLYGRSPLRRCPLRIDARTPDHPAGGV